MRACSLSSPRATKPRAPNSLMPEKRYLLAVIVIIAIIFVLAFVRL